MVSELRQTAFRNVRMSILSSRDHSCVHENRQASELSASEFCRVARKNHDCHHHTGFKSLLRDRRFTSGE